MIRRTFNAGDHWGQISVAYNPASGEMHVATRPDRYATWSAPLYQIDSQDDDQADTPDEVVRQLHSVRLYTDVAAHTTIPTCAECRQDHPCATIQTLDSYKQRHDRNQP